MDTVMGNFDVDAGRFAWIKDELLRSYRNSLSSVSRLASHQRSRTLMEDMPSVPVLIAELEAAGLDDVVAFCRGGDAPLWEGFYVVRGMALGCRCRSRM